MQNLKGLLKASHFGPTILVTSISFIFARLYWWEGPALVITLGVFLGQLVVGWSNDLIDYEDDVRHLRTKKPLVAGTITNDFLKKSLFTVLPIALAINLLGPLGFIAGGLSSFAIGCAVLYNFYFKFTPLSPIPYAIAFAALPTCMAISKGKPIHPWMWLGGALFGMAAHFINVIKDIDEDRESGIHGLPQLIGKKGSIFSSLALIVLGIVVLVGSR